MSYIVGVVTISHFVRHIVKERHSETLTFAPTTDGDVAFG